MRLIDADALKKFFHAEWDDVLVWDESGETTADQFCDLVDIAPTIEAEPVKRGEWLAIGNTGLAACPCGYITDRYSIYNYCPNCGARMSEGSEEC